MPRRRTTAHTDDMVAAIRALFGVALLLGAAGCADAAPTGSARVERIIDGDTVVVRIGRGTERVRLIGIDAPEVAKRGEPGECFGDEATRILADLAPPGGTVVLERDAEARDVYGRLLAYVSVQDGGRSVLVNRELLARGAARILRIEPNTARAAEFDAVAAAARASGAGLWGACGK
ncbi:MAG: thermonuclease family protein [Acidobacteria bacterium]|nr:thermonuclease family protein [Acidobacteriota bacterium]